MRVMPLALPEKGTRLCRVDGAGRNDGDRGSGTLWVLAALGVIWFAATAAMMVGGVRSGRHRAHAAADLAALGAAAHADAGPARACGMAARIAQGSGGRMRRCTLHGRVADVWVTSDVRLGRLLGRLTISARARAGPAESGCASPDPDCFVVAHSDGEHS